MRQRNIQAVQVTYQDGSVESFETPEGWHRTHHNYEKGDTKPDQAHVTHEIHWVER